jgi:TPR repeat protein
MPRQNSIRARHPHVVGCHVQNRFIATLKTPFKFLPDIHPARPGGWACERRRSASSLSGLARFRKQGLRQVRDSMDRRETGDSEMARFEITGIECAALGEAPATADTFFDLGMMYSVGRGVSIDFVTAHKWFNLAAMRGNADAARLRREIAEQMSDGEIAQAQRAARAWLKAS